MECGTLLRFRFYPNAASMPFYDLFANGKPNAGASVFAAGMQALKDKKNSFKVLRLNTNAIIAHAEMPGIQIIFNRNMDLRRALAAELDGVTDQVLEQLGELGRICFDRWQGLACDGCSTLLDGLVQIA